MENKIENNKQLFITELRKINRDGIEELIQFLEKSDFFIAPASTKYNGSFDGGLCEHSLNVLKRLRTQYKEYIETPMNNNIEEYSDETLIICALLHGLHKIKKYSKYYKNVKNEDGIWVQEESYKTDEKLFLGDAAKSLYIIERYIKLSLEEWQAIYFYRGGWGVTSTEIGNISNAFNQNPLSILLYMACMEATYIDKV